MRISIRVSPRSSKNEVLPQPDGSYKARLTSAPTDGKANEQLTRLLSEFFDVPKSSVTIVAGGTSRKKLIDIADI